MDVKLGTPVSVIKPVTTVGVLPSIVTVAVCSAAPLGVADHCFSGTPIVTDELDATD